MSDPMPDPLPVPSATSRMLARLLPFGLILLFGAGVLLVYVVNPPHLAPRAPTAAKSLAPAPSPAAELTAARQRIADLEGTVAGLQAKHQAYAALGAQFTGQGILITLGEPELQFGAGKSTLPSPLPAGLTALAALLAQEPGLLVQVEGYTDNRGTAAANLTLSAQRAKAVKAVLVKLGSAPERIQSRGMGVARPVADNGTAEGRGRNRRIEVYLTEP